MKFRNFPQNFDKEMNKRIVSYFELIEKNCNCELIVGYVNNFFESIHGFHDGLICCVIQQRKNSNYKTSYYIFDKNLDNPIGRMGPIMKSKDDAIYFIDSLMGVTSEEELFNLEKVIKKEEMKR